ncbi:RNA polymerase sigma-70 factor [Microscilla marina]|uniref:RNA polymerase ECF-type sigma factor n=1 Tax=Microscilla marina ATCC 23134 TaxID=313606 RepID=A1ZZ70_MICM2|nr:RNA polymerase sigma-70 factor [Microscilla marina]EAY24329.1 RNA polymerase ECF-type sigma factor [Microscilla marina ATCC 23134]
MHKNEYSKYTDAQIVEKISAHNQSVFEYVFKRYYQELCNFAFMYLKVEQSSEEVVQETFINIWEKRQKLKIQSSIKAYLYTSVKNRSINYLKSKATQVSQKSHSTSSEEHPIHIAENATVEEAMHNAELQHVLSQAIAALPKRCSEIFTLTRIEGLSYQQVADQLGISKKTVEAQMGIAFKKLRIFIKQHWELMIVWALVWYI